MIHLALWIASALLLAFVGLALLVILGGAVDSLKLLDRQMCAAFDKWNPRWLSWLSQPRSRMERK